MAHLFDYKKLKEGDIGEAIWDPETNRVEIVPGKPAKQLIKVKQG